MGLLRCGHPEAGGRFCPECGLEAVPEKDPFIGRTIGDRYKIGELLNVGGMGRVYKGVQKSLERPVAIKVIHPHLLTSEEVVGRFLTEARASSRLNHPNVVSIYDFGRMPASDGGHLFLVMELLSGRDLRSVMNEGRLALKQIADVLRQTLAALGEAHHHGITHRDVKPENILIEARRGEPLHVKVIDFGIARVNDEQRRTTVGRVFGTPWYMAPEQAAGATVGPSADLYAVGVMLFEMLVGKVPFDDDAPSQILVKHMSDPRPDPRKVAPELNIPEELARTCMRAMEIDPRKRYVDAESFAAAIVQTATSEAWSSGKASMFPNKRPAHGGLALADTAVLTTPTRDGEAPLLGREADLAALKQLCASPGDARGIVVHGPPGVGRTRLLRALAEELAGAGTKVVSVRASPRPLGEVSLSGLAALVPALSGFTPGDLLAAPDGASDVAREGLRAILRHDIPAEREPELTRRAVQAALAWAAERAVAGKRKIVAIDDVHDLDGASQMALQDLLEGDAPKGFVVVMTSEHPPEVGFATRILGHELRGLPRDVASRLAPGITLPSTSRAEIEPLYVELLRRWRYSDEAPETLAELIERWLRRQAPAQQRTIQALAVAGAGAMRQIAEILPRPEDLDEAIRPLVDAGVIDVESGVMRLKNPIVGRAALSHAPAGAISEMHTRALAAVPDEPFTAELRAYHALRGDPTFETFMVVEQAAGVRARCGNDEAVVQLLHDALTVAREHELRGDSESQVAVSARLVFGRKLGEALLAAGRFDQAYGVLRETLELAPPRAPVRAHVLERLALLAHHRGRAAEAEEHRAEALAIADRANDKELAGRLRAPMPRIDTRPPRRAIFKTPPSGAPIPRSAPPSQKKRASERSR